MTYTLRNTKTGKLKEVNMTISEKEKYVKENPEWVNVINTATPVHFKGTGWFGKSKKDGNNK